jgi:hypothetical protein
MHARCVPCVNIRNTCSFVHSNLLDVFFREKSTPHGSIIMQPQMSQLHTSRTKRSLNRETIATERQNYSITVASKRSLAQLPSCSLHPQYHVIHQLQTSIRYNSRHLPRQAIILLFFYFEVFFNFFITHCVAKWI